MASKKITKSLADVIYDQDLDLSKLDMTIVSRIKAELKVEKEELRKDLQRRIKDSINSASKKRAFSLAAQKGSSSWLSALPLHILRCAKLSANWRICALQN